MGHLLAFDGSIYVTTPSGYELPSAGLWFCEFEAEQTTQTASALVVIRGSSNLYIGFESDGRLRIWFVTSGGNVTYNLNIPIGRNVVRVGLDFDTNSLSVLVNGVQELGVIESRIPLLSGSRDIVFSDWFGVRRFIGNLYYANINGQRYYNPSTSGGVGLILHDDVSFADGSIKNGHSDDRHFVYYDDGTSEPAPVVQTITVSDAVQQDEVELINSTQLIALDVMSAQQIDEISLVDIEVEQALAVPDAVQVDSYELISTSISSLIAIQNAVQQDESALITIEQLGSQTLNIFSATQVDEGSVIDISLSSDTEVSNGIQQDVSTLIDTSMILETLIYSAVQQDTASLILMTQPAEYRDLSALLFLPISNDLSLTPMSTVVQFIEAVEDITHTIQKV